MEWPTNAPKGESHTGIRSSQTLSVSAVLFEPETDLFERIDIELLANFSKFLRFNFANDVNQLPYEISGLAGAGLDCRWREIQSLFEIKWPKCGVGHQSQRPTAIRITQYRTVTGCVRGSRHGGVVMPPLVTPSGLLAD